MKQLAQAWIDACRPKTLPLACMSILVGSGLALATGHFSAEVFLLSLLTACLLQILSNLANDYGDGLRGVDNNQRLGPVRALQSGALSRVQIRVSLFVVAAICVGCGTTLLLLANLDATDWLAFTLLGVVAIIAALTYTLGSKPYGYAGLGDASVWLFFGCLGVVGSYYLHGAPLQASLLMPASACGLLAAAVLNVNNMRDIDNDRNCGKYTLAVRLGLDFARLYHHGLLLVALALFYLYLLLAGFALLHSAAFLLVIIPVWKHLQAINQAKSPAQIAPQLPVAVAYSVLINSWFVILLLLLAYF